MLGGTVSFGAFLKNVVLFLAGLLTACSGRQTGVATDGACREYTEENVSRLSSRDDVDSARKLRDWFIECDLTKSRLDEALRWASTAAEKGDDEDQRIYKGLVEAASRSKSESSEH
jgi:hypothetical protein